METSPLICKANQWTGFYMITASVMKELIAFSTGSEMLETLLLVNWITRFGTILTN